MAAKWTQCFTVELLVENAWWVEQQLSLLNEYTMNNATSSSEAFDRNERPARALFNSKICILRAVISDSAAPALS